MKYAQFMYLIKKNDGSRFVYILYFQVCKSGFYCVKWLLKLNVLLYNICNNILSLHSRKLFCFSRRKCVTCMLVYIVSLNCGLIYMLYSIRETKIIFSWWSSGTVCVYCINKIRYCFNFSKYKHETKYTQYIKT